MRGKIAFILITLIAGVTILVAPAFAQDADDDEIDNDNSFNVQLFRPSIFGGNFIAMDDAQTLSTLGFHIGILGNYTSSLLTDYEDDEPNFDYIEDLATIDAMLAFGTWSWLRLGVDVPIHFVNHRVVENVYDPLLTQPDLEDEDAEWDTELGDIRAALKLRLLRQDKHWLGWAILPFANFPTGKTESFLGEGRVTGGGKMALEHDFGPLNIGLNGGYLYRGEEEVLLAEVGDAITWGAGISHAWQSGFGFSIEYTGAYYTVDDTDLFRNMPQEVLGTLRYQFGERGPRLIAGAGPGASTGVGTPAYRIIGGLDYTYAAAEPTDGDLAFTVVDQDGNELSANLVVLGPDGQVAVSTVGSDWTGALPAGQYEVKANRDGYEGDAKSIYIAVGQTSKTKLVLKKIVIAAPTVLELEVIDKDTLVKLDANALLTGPAGKKSVAVSGGIAKLEVEPGKYDIEVGAEGYETVTKHADAAKSETTAVKIELRRTKIKIENIKFKTNSDVISPESYATLNEAVEALKKIAVYKKVEIAGHTDDQGPDAYNLKLSQRRANSVKNYLVKQGIDGAKLEAVGYGETKPIADNTTDVGRAQNRRVEFIITYE